MEYETTTGTVFDLSRYCLQDGPGIRTTVFLKGCPLRCTWCHNPESQSARPEILFSTSQCVNCGACVAACPKGCHTIEGTHVFDRAKCVGCGACAAVCPTEALRLAGRTRTAAEVIREVLKDKVFYNTSGGGMTVSGGEPTVQLDFLEALLVLARRKGLHTAIETCGYAPTRVFERIAPLVDLFLFDYKESAPERHLRFTGVKQDLILENLAYLDRIGKEIILRIPLIPSFNATEEHLYGIAETAKRYRSVRKIEVLPYHPLGVSKEDELGFEKKAEINVPDKALLDRFIDGLRASVDVPVELCV